MLRAQLLLSALVLSMLFGTLPVYAQTDLEQQMIAADRGLLEAMAGPQPDMERYEAGLAPDYLDVEFGTVHSREEDLKQAKMLRGLLVSV